jgi:hypothetical protein
MTPRDVTAAVKSGRLVCVRRAVYCDAEALKATTHWQDRQILVDRAASMVTGRPHVLSHDSAALRLQMQILKAQAPNTHLTSPEAIGLHAEFGIKHHLAPYHAKQVVHVEGSAVLEPARTALDIAREHGYRSGLVAVDSAYRVGATSADFRRALEAMTSWPHVRVARRAFDDGDPDTDTIAETLGRELVEELGFGGPKTQFGLAADGRVVWIDIRLGRHFFEVDGKIKLTPIADGGVAESPVDALWEEKQRQDFITGFKTGLSRMYWQDFFGSAREEAKARLRREYLDTCRRFGTDISDLAQYRPREPRRRTTWPPAA